MTVYEVIAGASSPTHDKFVVVILAEVESAGEATRVLEKLWERFPNHGLDVCAVRPVQAEVAWDFWQKTAGIVGRIMMTLRLDHEFPWASATKREPNSLSLEHAANAIRDAPLRANILETLRSLKLVCRVEEEHP